MSHFMRLIFSAFALLVLFHGTAIAQRTVRVGVYPDPPHIVPLGENTYGGIDIQVLKLVAKEQGWTLVWVPGSWPETYSRLQRNEVDIVPAVAPTDIRNAMFDFTSETLLLNWGVVYTNSRIEISSVLDIDGRTVAVMREGYIMTEFLDLLDQFDLSADIIWTDSHEDSMAMVDSGEAELCAVDRLYGEYVQHTVNAVSTPVIFSPFPSKFAVLRGENQQLISAMDGFYQEHGPNSALVAPLITRWLNRNPVVMPAWAKFGLALLGLATLVLGVRLLTNIRKSAARKAQLERERLQRMQAENSVSETQRLLHATFDAIQDPVMIIDKDMHIVASNWKGMDHIPEHVRQCRPFCYLSFHGRREKCSPCPAQEMFTTGQSHVFEHVSPVDGRVFEISITPIKDENDEVILAVEHIRDITGHKAAQEALRRSEERLQKVIDNAPLIIWSLDPEGTLTLHQGLGLETLGLPPGVHEGESLFDVYADHPSVCELARKALQGEHVSDIMTYKSFIFDVRYAPITNTRGELVETIGVAFDITESKKANSELGRAHFMLSSHVDNSPLAVIEWDAGFRVARWSGRANEIFGWTADEVLGKTPEEIGFVYPQDIDSVTHTIDDLVQGRVPHNKSRNRNITRAGRVIHCEWYNSVHFDAAGHTISILSLAQNITDAVEAQKALAAANENLEKQIVRRTFELEKTMRDMAIEIGRTEIILASVADGLIVTDNENRILNLNRAAETILGFTLEHSRGKRLEDVIPDRTLCDKLSSNIRKANSFDSYQFEVEIVDPASGPMSIQARTAVIRESGDGEQRGVVISLRDVTADREVDRMKSEFISTAAHELRTPLTSIQGFSELLLTRNALDPTLRERYLGYINKHAAGLAGIISDLLDISRIESGKGFSFDKKAFDLCDAVASKVDAFDATNPKHDFIFTPPDQTCEVVADRGKIEQLLENLLSNAVKYSPEGGPVEVIIDDAESLYSLFIVDQGIGMTLEQTTRIFEKFYRGHSANGSIPGTGLGMSIVKHIVEGHGGQVFIESEHGLGTSVQINIPKDGVGLPIFKTTRHADTASNNTASV